MHATVLVQLPRHSERSMNTSGTDGSHSSDDPRLQKAKKFYKSCTNYRSPDTFISALSFWISTCFSKWDLLPSTAHNDAAPNIKYMDLTDFCLPAISHLGSSPLFSLTMDPRTRSIKVSDYFKIH
ncbi:Endothelin-converting enzyme [Schistosoma japonicum]|nr:Endothelin-converting enzyme [Schistosoma japonicum]